MRRSPPPTIQNPDENLHLARFHVLIATGDPTLRGELADSLNIAGFRVDEVTLGKEALDRVRQRSYDLVLLSLGLPDESGIETCRKLRETSSSLGIAVVRVGGTAQDDMAALDAGTDDCIAAPFRFRELTARLAVVLRRIPAEHHSKTSVLKAGVLELDIVQRSFHRAGNEVHLSPREFELLRFLMTNEGVILTHAKLLSLAFGTPAHDRSYLRSYIMALRKKVESDPARPRYILTEPWVGYRFNTPHDVS